jgi:hypothetical protein
LGEQPRHNSGNEVNAVGSLWRLAAGFVGIGLGVAGMLYASQSAPSTISQPANGELLAAVRISTPSNGLTALDVLDTIPVSNEQPAGYDRDLFSHWSSQGNGCDTRDRVLIDESGGSAQVSYPGCAVVAGDWYSTYDNQNITDPSLIDIDHVIALKESWDSGAHAWTPERREAFANDLSDPSSLAAVTSTSNASKGARDPSNWIPSHQPAVCGYLADWVSIKARWKLNMDQSEHGRIRNLLKNCRAITLVIGDEPVVNEPDPNPDPESCDPSYPTVCIPPPPPDLNCADIEFRNFVVLQPDPHRFDGNKDGIGCT